MASIEMIQKDGVNFFIGIIEFDDCSEVMENFDGEVQNGKYIVANTVDTLEKLYRDDLIDRGERESLENCDVIAFTGVKIK